MVTAAVRLIMASETACAVHKLQQNQTVRLRGDYLRFLSHTKSQPKGLQFRAEALPPRRQLSLKKETPPVGRFREFMCSHDPTTSP